VLQNKLLRLHLVASARPHPSDDFTSWCCCPRVLVFFLLTSLDFTRFSVGRAGARPARQPQSVPQRTARDEGDRAHGHHHRVLLRHVAWLLRALRRLRMVSVSHQPVSVHDHCPGYRRATRVPCPRVSIPVLRSSCMFTFSVTHNIPDVIQSFSLVSWCPSASCPVPRSLSAFFFWLGYSNSTLNPVLVLLLPDLLKLITGPCSPSSSGSAIQTRRSIRFFTPYSTSTSAARFSSSSTTQRAKVRPHPSVRY